MKASFVGCCIRAPVGLVFLVCLHGYTSKETAVSADVAVRTDFQIGDQKLALGQLSQAKRSYELTYQHGLFLKDEGIQAKALARIGICDFKLYRYQAAAATLIHARDLASSCHDPVLEGSTELTLASLYLQLHDLAEARSAAQKALDLFRTNAQEELAVKALINSGSIELEAGNLTLGRAQMQRAIGAAQKTRQPLTEALAWEFLGESELIGQRPASAIGPLLRALALRGEKGPATAITVTNLADAYCHLGDFRQAQKYFDHALPLHPNFPEYYTLHLQGKILRGLGDEAGALKCFSKAVDAARRWFQDALLPSATGTATLESLHDVYADYGHLLAAGALKTHSQAMSKEGFLVVAENHAADLRSHILADVVATEQLPPRYFTLLDKLALAQAREPLSKGAQGRSDSDTIRIQLRDIQNSINPALNAARLSFSRDPSKFVAQLQRQLTSSEALLTFSVGPESYLWVLTVSDIFLYQLPTGNTLRSTANSFNTTERGGAGNSADGTALSQMLFGSLDPRIWQKPIWLLFTDDASLQQVPFGVLPDLKAPPLSIVNSHALEFLVSETALIWPHVKEPPSTLLVVGDPVYNTADQRAPKITANLNVLPGALSLPRLPGSGREIKTVVQVNKSKVSTSLSGMIADRTGVLRALRQQPGFIHFATHIVTQPDRPESAAVALSIDHSGLPTLLENEDIAAIRLPGTVVILDGCESQGKAISETGLLGLGRAWLTAGASAVIVTSWPSVENDGEFFSVFYRKLNDSKTQTLPMSLRVALALQEAQKSALHGNTFLSKPSFWGNYSIIARR